MGKGREEVLTVDGIVDPFVHPVDLFMKFNGIEVQFGLFLGEQVVERRVEDPDNFRRLVVGDSVLLLIP